MTKKKVAYITRHAVVNYGSALQTYATQTAIEKLGYEAVCIDYVREDETIKNIAATRMAMSRWNKNALTRLLYRITQKPVLDHCTKRFQNFNKSLIKKTPVQYHTNAELKANLPEADVYMTGSDQVWNTITYDKIDPAYFLSFVPDGKRKIAYAGSFGGKTVKDSDKDTIAALLKRYDAISVREKSGVKIVESLGAEAVQVLDPTFLVDRNDWLKIIPERESAEKYVLVYQLHPNKDFEAYAKSFAARKKLKLIRVNTFFHHIVKPGKFVYCPPLEEFLWYIKNAEYFLTDSFHGTAFAIGLNTQFVDVLPNKYSERNRSILEVAGLENRILDSYDDLAVADKPIDFDAVNKKIDAERKKSLEVLRDLIEG